MTKDKKYITTKRPLELPKEVQEFYRIRLLGTPFAYMDENRKIREAYKLDGKTYVFA